MADLFPLFLYYGLLALNVTSSFLPALPRPILCCLLSSRSFFRSDKLVGTAHLKLERLENECEIREIMEVGPG